MPFAIVIEPWIPTQQGLILMYTWCRSMPWPVQTSFPHFTPFSFPAEVWGDCSSTDMNSSLYSKSSIFPSTSPRLLAFLTPTSVQWTLQWQTVTTIQQLIHSKRHWWIIQNSWFPGGKDAAQPLLSVPSCHEWDREEELMQMILITNHQQKRRARTGNSAMRYSTL